MPSMADITEKREDRRVDKEAAWGADAGKLEETRILEMLDAKWNKINDTVSSHIQIQKHFLTRTDEHTSHPSRQHTPEQDAIRT